METKAKIFLAEDRNCDDTERFRVYNTFNCDRHYNEHKQPFGNLQALNDITLAEGESFRLKKEPECNTYVLPVVGGFTCHDKIKNENAVQPGQLMRLENSAASFQITNLYDNELINLLEVRVQAGNETTAGNFTIFDFNLDENKNKLVPVTNGFPCFSIGKLAGRNEAAYHLNDNRNSLFVFIIQGAFEVEGRLLHARDGLGLWDISEDIELEALSNDAIVLLIESGR